MILDVHSPKLVKLIQSAYGFVGGGGGGMVPLCPPMSSADFTVVPAACGMASDVQDISTHESAKNEHTIIFFIVLRIKN